VAVGVVVVGELFAARDAARGADPDRAVLDLDVAVRAAGMIDEARDVAADTGVDDGAVRELEAPDVAAPDVAALTPEALLVGDLLAGIVDDARVFRDGPRRVDSPSMDPGPPPGKHPY